MSKIIMPSSLLKKMVQETHMWYCLARIKECYFTKITTTPMFLAFLSVVTVAIFILVDTTVESIPMQIVIYLSPLFAFCIAGVTALAPIDNGLEKTSKLNDFVAVSIIGLIVWYIAVLSAPFLLAFTAMFIIASHYCIDNGRVSLVYAAILPTPIFMAVIFRMLKNIMTRFHQAEAAGFINRKQYIIVVIGILFIVLESLYEILRAVFQYNTLDYRLEMKAARLAVMILSIVFTVAILFYIFRNKKLDTQEPSKE